MVEGEHNCIFEGFFSQLLYFTLSLHVKSALLVDRKEYSVIIGQKNNSLCYTPKYSEQAPKKSTCDPLFNGTED